MRAPDSHPRDAARGADLAAWSADRLVRRLYPARPLWRIEIVDGLPGGRFGLLVVLHHVLADGLTGVAIAGRLLDTTADAADPTCSPQSAPASAPTHRALVAGARRGRRRAATAALCRVPRLPADLLRIARQVRDAAGYLRAAAPRTSLPRRIGLIGGSPSSGSRSRSCRRGRDRERRAARRRHRRAAGTVLFARGEQVDGLTLRSSVPVGVTGTGQTAAMLLGLPVGEPGPGRRLAAFTEATAALKRRLRADGGDVFDVLRLPAPLARLAVRWLRRHAARHIKLFVRTSPARRGRCGSPVPGCSTPCRWRRWPPTSRSGSPRCPPASRALGERAGGAIGEMDTQVGDRAGSAIPAGAPGPSLPGPCQAVGTRVRRGGHRGVAAMTTQAGFRRRRPTGP